MPQRINEIHLAVASLATQGDAGGLYRLIARLLDEGTSLPGIFFDVLLPVEREVGHRWQAGEYLVAEEHAVTATIETVVSLLAGSLEQPPDGEHVVIAAVEGDTHSLAARAVSADLLLAGFRTTFLGANVLSADLREFLQEESPDALVLSSAMAIHLLGARAGIEAGHDAGVPVLVGGRGFGEEGRWASVLGADAWAPTPPDVSRILRSWSPHPAAAEAGAPRPGPSLVSLVENRSAVAAETETQVLARSPDLDLAVVRSETEMLISALSASLLVAEAGPLVEVLEWQRHTLPFHGLGRPGVLADALAAALGSTLEGAAAMLASARAVIGA